jgi:putative membrane protein
MPINLMAHATSLAPLGRPVAAFVPLQLSGLGELIVATLAFSILGILLFALAFWVIVKVSPFSVRKELEDDQNVALGIVIGAVIIGIALIVAAAVHG